MILSFEEFKMAAKQIIEKQNPESTVEIRRLEKSTGAYDGMTVHTDGNAVCPVLNLNNYFDDYIRGIPYEQLIANMLEVISIQPDINIQDLTNWDMVKEDIFIRIVNAEDRAAYLTNKPHQIIEGTDLALTYHIGINSEASVPVSNELLALYDISQYQLHAQAMYNCSQLNVEAKPLAEIIAELTGLPVDANGAPNNLFVVQDSKAGAAAHFFPDVLECLEEKCGGSFYILPSSVHELLILSEIGNELNARELKEMVTSINLTDVAPADKLSDSVYFYDSETHKLAIAQDLESQINKAQNKSRDNISPAM